MFPTPIERTPRTTRFAYRAALFASLAIWLLPILGVALTSVRSLAWRASRSPNTAFAAISRCS
jgi:multiple sugar transport system permease protein